MKKSLIFVLLGFVVTVVAPHTSYSDPSVCNQIIFDRPTTYADGSDMPTDKPDGYFVFFSKNSAPTKANSQVVELKGANTTKTAVLKNLGDGKHYVRATAYNVMGDGNVESGYSNTASFFLTGGQCTPPAVPGAPSRLKLSFAGG